MRQRFGAGVRQEVLGEVMSQSFYEAVTQENLRPAGQPSIEPKTMDEGKDLEFVATFEGEEVVNVSIDPAVSANPYFEFDMKVPGPGTVRFEWTDDDGTVYDMEKTIKAA